MTLTIKPIRIIGIDPGSRLTGYGIVDVLGKEIRHVTHGTLELSNTSGPTLIAFEERLLRLFNQLSEVIEHYKPSILSIEKVFFAKNAVSALKLGQARGVAIVCGALQGLKIVEYNPTEVKSSIAGSGRADKDQIAKMLRLLMGELEFVTTDASDGLALAYCHARQLQSPSTLNNASKSQLHEVLKKRTRRSQKLSLAESLVHKIKSTSKSK
jgi:crossover junction endodeoxyribonuclease RuvC